MDLHENFRFKDQAMTFEWLVYFGGISSSRVLLKRQSDIEPGVGHCGGEVGEVDNSVIISDFALRRSRLCQV